MDSIKILGEVYKFDPITYHLGKDNFIKINECKIEYNNRITSCCLLKTIEGNIENNYFNYEKLNKEIKMYDYLKIQNNVKFVNDISLKINNKKWFEFDEDGHRTIVRCPSIKLKDDLLDNDQIHFNLDKLWEICIISTENKQENFEVIPIFYFNGSMRYKNTPIITTLEVIINILTKYFPSFEAQLKLINSNELNINEINKVTLDEYENLTNEELRNLLHERDSKIEKYEAKTKPNSLEETEKLYDKYMNESELFRNEVKRYLIETQKQFIDSYIEGSKIKIIDSFKSNSRSTSSIELGDSGENYVKDLLNELKIKYEDTSGTAYQSDIHIKDEVNKIIYILEVKNRSSIPRSEITKFNRDIENITKLNQDYTIVPLFISLSNSNINESKGKFSITDNVTYITLPYVTKETLQMFFELNRNNIKYIQKNKNIKEVLEEKTKLIEEKKSINSHIEIIETKLNEVTREVKELKEETTQNLYYGPKNLKETLLEEILNRSNFILYKVKEMDINQVYLNKYWNKQKVINWAKSQDNI